MTNDQIAEHATHPLYKRVMRGSAFLAGMAASAWTVAAVISLSDGEGGIEVPRWLSTAGVMVIICSTLTFAAAWIAEQSLRIAAEQLYRPIAREEFDKALADCLPLLVATVTEAADRRAARVGDAVGHVIDGQMQGVATAAAKRTAAYIKEQQTAEVTEICEALHRKTLIAGMQLQANATGEQLGKAALRAVKTYVSTSRGD